MKGIKYITIRNYKSIENVKIEGCKTFNLFIGQPNVGKSNIIEALSLFAIPYLSSMKKSMRQFFRVEHDSALFFNGNVSNSIDVSVDNYSLQMQRTASNQIKLSTRHLEEQQSLGIVDLKVKKGVIEYPIFKPYVYEEHDKGNWDLPVEMPFLCPWNGNNMMQVLQQDESLKQYFVNLLKEYNLQLTFDLAQQEIRVLKPIDESSSFIIPYMALADTLKRLLFYKAAVESKKDSVLMFEELEAHAYPPYIIKIIQSIIQKPSNQYFITTHSPYVINEFLEVPSLDVAVHIVDYKEGKTIVKTWSKDEMGEVYNYGIDLFFNTEAFFD